MNPFPTNGVLHLHSKFIFIGPSLVQEAFGSQGLDRQGSGTGVTSSVGVTKAKDENIFIIICIGTANADIFCQHIVIIKSTVYAY